MLLVMLISPDFTTKLSLYQTWASTSIKVIKLKEKLTLAELDNSFPKKYSNPYRKIPKKAEKIGLK
jgi:hypothetical protein